MGNDAFRDRVQAPGLRVAGGQQGVLLLCFLHGLHELLAAGLFDLVGGHELAQAGRFADVDLGGRRQGDRCRAREHEGAARLPGASLGCRLGCGGGGCLEVAEKTHGSIIGKAPAGRTHLSQ